MPYISDGSGESAAMAQANQIANGAAQAALRQLKASVPVDTGLMRASCRITGRGSGAFQIQSNVFYRIYVDGYYRAVRIARSRAKAAVRGFKVQVRFIQPGSEPKMETKVISASEAVRVGGNRLAITVQAARRFRFTMHGIVSA